jgi:hypothetical protein
MKKGAAEPEMLRDPLRVRLGVAKRHYLLRAQRIALRRRVARNGTDEPPTRPVFVVGCPRSGTSLVYTLLRCHDAFRSPEGEGHLLWNAYQHPRFTGWSSDRATAADVRPEEPRFIYSVISQISGEGRFLDKTPKNVLKIPYLARLFPDATFVLLRRDGRDTVNSLIEGWQVRQTPSYRLPQRLELADYRGRLWSFILPPEWRRWARSSVAEVAAYQYASSYDVALEDVRALPPDSVVHLAFEDFLARPEREASRVLERLGLKPTESVLEMARNLDRYPVVTNSAPRAEKWRERAHEIARVWPLIEPTMERLGYDVTARP